MKKALSIVLSVAMMLTIACSMFVMPASAEHISFLDPEKTSIGGLGATFEYNEDGDLVIYCDGTDLVSSSIAIAGPGAYDAAVYQFTRLSISSEVPFVIAMYDAANNKWMTSNGDFYPDFGNDVGEIPAAAGDYNLDLFTNGCYTWGGQTLPETVEMTSIYIEPKAEGTMVIKDFYLVDPNAVDNFEFAADPMFETTEVFDLADKDVDMWEQVPVSGSRVTFTVDEEANTLTLGNTAGKWPCAYVDFVDPIVADPDTAMIYADFTVEKGAKTTLYVFFGDTNATEFASGAYAVVHDIYGAEVGAGNYKGYINVADILPVDEAARAACFDEDGNLLVTAIKLYATSVDPDAVMDPAVTFRSLDFMYNVPVVDDDPQPPVDDKLPGDINDDGTVDMMDAFAVYQAASTGNVPENVLANADMNDDGVIDMMDAFPVYRIASGA